MAMLDIPDKLYFKIGEVSRITGIKTYILRYWESEFKILSPLKSGGNQRVYTRKDVELIVYIKKLLYNDKFTLEGAKKRVGEFRKQGHGQLSLPLTGRKYSSTLKNIRKELRTIKKMLSP